MHAGGLGPPLPGRIPWAAIRDWACAHDRGPADAALLDACLIAMDGVYLAWWRAQQPVGKGS